MWFIFLAEKEGFEPSIPCWGIHDFQSCALGQLRDFSSWFGALINDSLNMILQICPIVKDFLQNLSQIFNQVPL